MTCTAHCRDLLIEELTPEKVEQAARKAVKWWVPSRVRALVTKHADTICDVLQCTEPILLVDALTKAYEKITDNDVPWLVKRALGLVAAFLLVLL